MAKQDFSKISEQFSKAAGTGRRGQGEITAEEKAEREATGRTQGRKGCQKPVKRLNFAMTPENHDFVMILSKASGKNMTDVTNSIITKYRAEHPELQAEAQKFVDIVNGHDWA